MFVPKESYPEAGSAFRGFRSLADEESVDRRIGHLQLVHSATVRLPFCFTPAEQNSRDASAQPVYPTVYARLMAALILVVQRASLTERYGRGCSLGNAVVWLDRLCGRCHRWIAWLSERLVASRGLTAQIRPQHSRAAE